MRLGSFLTVFLLLVSCLDPSNASGPLPPKAIEVLQYVRETGRPPWGYVGGRRFDNFERRLPLQGSYREYDVDPRPPPGRSRNAERIVVDERSGRAWYTADHYKTFTEIE